MWHQCALSRVWFWLAISLINRRSSNQPAALTDRRPVIWFFEQCFCHHRVRQHGLAASSYCDTPGLLWLQSYHVWGEIWYVRNKLWICSKHCTALFYQQEHRRENGLVMSDVRTDLDSDVYSGWHFVIVRNHVYLAHRVNIEHKIESTPGELFDAEYMRV